MVSEVACIFVCSHFEPSERCDKAMIDFSIKSLCNITQANGPFEPHRFRISSLFGGGSHSNVSNEGSYYPAAHDANAIYSHHYEVPNYIPDSRHSQAAQQPQAPPPPVPPKQGTTGRHHKNKHKSTSNLVRRSSSKISLGGGQGHDGKKDCFIQTTSHHLKHFQKKPKRLLNAVSENCYPWLYHH